MPTSAARKLEAESRAHVRTTSSSTTRKSRKAPAPRPTRRAALYDELARLERDLADLREDFETRIGPLTKAYATSCRKLKELERALKGKKRRRS